MGSRKKERRKKRKQSVPGSPSAPTSAESLTMVLTPDIENTPSTGELPEDVGELLVAQWQSTRWGARSGRGYHFQDAVGAWLAAQLATGTLDATSIVPEGLEDMSIEGEQPLHVQIKSRVEHLGPFSPRDAARHILSAWKRRRSVVENGTRLALVLERGVNGEHALDVLDLPLAYCLSMDSPLRGAVNDLAAEQGISSEEVERALSSVAVLGTTWAAVTAGTTELLSNLVAVPPSALALLVRELHFVVAGASDANATTDYRNRRALNRTSLVAAVTRVAEQIDLDSLESAIRDGICESLDLSQPGEADDRFYEGTSTQPAHVAAGLISPAPRLSSGGSVGAQRTVRSRDYWAFWSRQERCAVDCTTGPARSPLVPSPPTVEAGFARLDSACQGIWCDARSARGIPHRLGWDWRLSWLVPSASRRRRSAGGSDSGHSAQGRYHGLGRLIRMRNDYGEPQ